MAPHKVNPDKADPIEIITATQFAAIMTQDCACNQIQKIAVAISGGADSFALLHLVQEWAKNYHVTVTALTVDHQLRSTSADEAQHVAGWCAQQGIQHHILCWEGIKPDTAIQEQARHMRRKLLGEFCRDHGITHLCLGHQADDQTETFFMRLQRGSGMTGLAAMHHSTHNAQYGLTILRPLLSVRRMALRHYCLEHHLPFIDDPSNENQAFERVRMRQKLQDFPDITKGITRSTQRLQRADIALTRMAQNWCDVYLQKISCDIYWLPYAEFILLDTEIRLRILLHIRSLLNPTDTSLSMGLSTGLSSELEIWEQQITAHNFNGSNMSHCWARPKIHNKSKGIALQPEPPRRKNTRETSKK